MTFLNIHRDMQNRDDPDRLREIFETDTSLSSDERAQLMKRVETALTDSGRQQEANQARWDAALFRHHLRTFSEEMKGRFGFSLDLSLGTVVPDPKICTEDVLDHFEHRAIETSNPVLKSWYSDFVWSVVASMSSQGWQSMPCTTHTHS